MGTDDGRGSQPKRSRIDARLVLGVGLLTFSALGSVFLGYHYLTHDDRSSDASAAPQEPAAGEREKRDRDSTVDSPSTTAHRPTEPRPLDRPAREASRHVDTTEKAPPPKALPPTELVDRATSPAVPPPSTGPSSSSHRRDDLERRRREAEAQAARRREDLRREALKLCLDGVQLDRDRAARQRDFDRDRAVRDAAVRGALGSAKPELERIEAAFSEAMARLDLEEQRCHYLHG